MPNKLFEYIEKYYYSKYGLPIGYLLLILFFTTLNNFISDYIKEPYCRLSLYILIVFIYSILWSISNYKIPVIKGKHNIPIIISIETETKEQMEKIKKDVIEKIENII